MEVSIAGITGLYGGLACGIIAWWFGRQKAKKNRGLDELYHHIWQKARSYSWFATAGVIYIFFSLIMFGIELSTAMVLGVLLFTHLGSWAVCGVVFSINMSIAEPLKPSRVVIGVTIVVASLIAFTITSVVTKNWMFLLASIPPNIIGLMTALTPNKRDAGHDEH